MIHIRKATPIKAFSRSDSQSRASRFKIKKVSCGLGLILMLVASPAMVTDASAALPEFEISTGFSSVGTEPFVIEGLGGAVISCKKSEGDNGGFVAASKLAKGIVLVLKECSDGNECKSIGAGKGEIRTGALVGEVGYIRPAVMKAEAVAFSLAGEGFESFAKFGCGIENYELRGCVIGRLTKTEELTNTFHLVFKEMGGKQEITDYEVAKGGAVAKCKFELYSEGLNMSEEAGVQTEHTIKTCPNMEKIKD